MPVDFNELAAFWGVERGQVWLCGEHRIMCGDATNADDVSTLLAGAKPELMVTDPPYGVNYDAQWRADCGLNRQGAAVGLVTNDDNADWTDAWLLSPSPVAYVYHAGIASPTVFNSLTGAGYEPVNLIIWNKHRMIIGRGNYHHKHEPIWYMVRRGSTHLWGGSRTETTVWDIDANMRNLTGHSTQKPVECMERPIRNHICTGVYDPFMGSGSTLIACINRGKTCYGMEIEPGYVALILQEYKYYTFDDPIKEES